MYETSLILRTGAKPIGVSNIINNETERIHAKGIPSGIKEYTLHEISFEVCKDTSEMLANNLITKEEYLEKCGNYYKSANYDSKLLAITSPTDTSKIIILDADDDGDFSDERVFNLVYHRDPKIEYNDSNPIFRRDKYFGVDNHPKNELFINLKNSDGSIRSRYLLEVASSCMSKMRDEGLDKHLCLTLKEHYYSELVLDSITYSIYINRDLRNLENSINHIAYEKGLRPSNKDFWKFFRSNTDTIKIGRQIFKIGIDDEWKKLQLTEIMDIDVRKKYHEDYIPFMEGNVIDIKSKNTKRFSDLLLDDEYTLVHFWGTWCGACKDNFPSLKSLLDKESLNVVGIALERNAKIDKVTQVLMKYNLVGKNYIQTLGNKSFSSIKFFPQYYLFDGKKLISQSGTLKNIQEAISRKK